MDNGAQMTGTEVKQKQSRRRLTKEYKLKILQEYDSVTRIGEKGKLLRREGIYSSMIIQWRQSLLVSKGASVQQHVLEVENIRLKKELTLAQTVIDVQKKILSISELSSDMK